MQRHDSDQQRACALVVLATLLGTAYFSAVGAVELASARWLLAPAMPAADGGALEHVAFELWRDRRDDGAAVLLRNVFDSHLGPMTYDAPVPPPGARARLPTPMASHAACEAPLRLVASWVTYARPERSMASLAVGGEPPRLVGAGARIEEHTLVSIGEERVVLEGPDAQSCEVVMFARSPLPPAAGAPPVVGDLALPPRASGRFHARLEAGITSSRAGAWTIRRDLVEQLLADPTQVMSLARGVPHEESGRVTSMEVLLVPRRGVLDRLGVRTGDVLRAVNGRSLASAEDALAAYTELRSAGRVSLSLLRAGAPVTLEYSIE